MNYHPFFQRGLSTTPLGRVWEGECDQRLLRLEILVCDWFRRQNECMAAKILERNTSQ